MSGGQKHESESADKIVLPGLSHEALSEYPYGSTEISAVPHGGGPTCGFKSAWKPSTAFPFDTPHDHAGSAIATLDTQYAAATPGVHQTAGVSAQRQH